MYGLFILVFIFVLYRLYKIVDSYNIEFKDDAGKQSCVYEPHNMEKDL